MAQCTTKGCAYSALIGETKCRNHLERPEIPKPVSAAPEYEIVKMEVVPKFKIKNEKSYNIAKAIASLAEGHALKVRVDNKATSLATSISNYCAKLGVKVRHREAPGCVFFWKDVKK